MKEVRVIQKRTVFFFLFLVNSSAGWQRGEKEGGRARSSGFGLAPAASPHQRHVSPQYRGGSGEGGVKDVGGRVCRKKIKAKQRGRGEEEEAEEEKEERGALWNIYSSCGLMEGNKLLCFLRRDTRPRLGWFAVSLRHVTGLLWCSRVHEHQSPPPFFWRDVPPLTQNTNINMSSAALCILTARTDTHTREADGSLVTNHTSRLTESHNQLGQKEAADQIYGHLLQRLLTKQKASWRLKESQLVQQKYVHK